jgi:hypothetical protein
MAFTAPIWLAVAALASALLVLAHFLTSTAPRQELLPTARFVPEEAPRIVVRPRRLTDVWLLLLRVLAVALLGMAFAGAHLRHSAPTRIVLADMSRAVASRTTVVDSVSAQAAGAPIIAFAAKTERAMTKEGLGTTDAGRAMTAERGSLSAAIIAARRLLAETPYAGTSTELVIVSPLVEEEVDSATRRLLADWPGSVRFIRVAAATDSAARGWEVRAQGVDPDDPVAAALGTSTAAAAARVVRSLPTAADSQWARDGGALVVWPASPTRSPLAPRVPVDTQTGVVANGIAAIGSFTRASRPREGRVVARWTDGEPAATEVPHGRGCVREVAIPVDAAGDLALRESFRSIARTLVTPCGEPRAFGSVDVASILPAASRAPSLAGGQMNFPADSLPRWLALAALLALGGEHVLRSRRREKRA